MVCIFFLKTRLQLISILSNLDYLAKYYIKRVWNTSVIGLEGFAIEFSWKFLGGQRVAVVLVPQE